MRHRIANNFPFGPALLALTVLAALLMATVSAAGTEFNARPATQPATQPTPTRTSPPLPGLPLPLMMTGNPPASTAPAGENANETANVPQQAPVVATQPSAVAASPVVTSALDSLPINRGDGPAAPTTQPTAQAAAAPSATSFEVGRVVMSLLAVIGLILFLKWGSKKVFAMPSSGGTAVMQVVSRTTLAPRQQLLLVRVGRRLMVIGDSAAGRLSGLGEIADPDEVASLIGQTHSTAASPVAATSFTNMFRRFSGRGQQDAGWDELQQDSPPGLIRERSGLLGDDGASIAVADGEMDDLPAEPDRSAPPAEGATADEIEAQKAVEAARYDIQALRAKLREVTGRLTDPPAAQR